MEQQTRVLVVVDADSASRFRGPLVAAGFDVEVASTGGDGLERWASWSPDAVVVAASLPDQSGIDVVRAIHRGSGPSSRTVRVVLAGPRVSVQERLMVAMEGALDYLTEPIDGGTLAERVRQLLAAGPAEVVRQRIQRSALQSVTALESGRRQSARDPFAIWSHDDDLGAAQPAFRSRPEINLPGILLSTTVAGLTARQQLVVAMLGETDSIAEAAGRLSISASALSSRLKAIATRLGLSGVTELITLARRHQVLDAAADAIYGLGSDGVCLFANKAAALLFDLRLEDLVGSDVHALIHHSRPDGTPLDSEDCPIRQALQSKRAGSVDQDVFWRRDGTPVWVAYSVVPVMEAGEGYGAVVTARDITATVQAAEQLRLSHAGFALALEAASTVAFQFDLSTRTLVHSENFERLLGLDPRDSPLGIDDFLALVHPDDLHKVDLDRVAIAPVGAVFEEELRIVSPDGGVRRFNARARTMPGPLGRPGRLLGVLVDVTGVREEERIQQLILDTSTDAFVRMGAEGIVTGWNDAAEKMFLYAADDAIGRPMAELIIPERHRDAHAAAIRRIIDDPPTQSRAGGPLEVMALRADGSEVPIELTFTTVSTATGPAFAAFARDITGRTVLQEELLRAQRQAADSLATLEALQNTAPVAIGMVDCQYRVVHLNEHMAALNGLTPEDAVGLPIEAVLGERWPTVEPLYAAVLGTSRPILDIEVHRPTAVGRPSDWLASYYPVHANGDLIGVGVVALDVTERNQEEQFRKVVMETMAEGLYALDEDGRLTYMNAAATRMLGWTAAELHGKPMHDAVHFQRADGSPFPAGECPLVGARTPGRPVRVSGDAFTRKDGAAFPVAYSAAPIRSGERVSGVVVVFRDISEEMDDAERAEWERSALSWTARIRNAIDEDNLVLYSQPIVAAESGDGDGGEEMLVRMVGPTGEVLPAGAFLGVAERTHLITDIDRWVLARAIRRAADGRRVAVNLSAATIRHPETLSVLERELASTGAAPANVVVDITEAALMEDGDAGEAFLRGLEHLGVQVALDDFGTGSSSLDHLTRLPISYLKIDGAVVRDVLTSPHNQRVVKAIVSVARTFGLRTIAEGVEEQAAWDNLRAEGVDYGQGIHLGPPTPIQVQSHPG